MTSFGAGSYLSSKRRTTVFDDFCGVGTRLEHVASQDQPAGPQAAREIFDEFLASDAPRQVHVAMKTRKALSSNLDVGAMKPSLFRSRVPRANASSRARGPRIDVLATLGSRPRVAATFVLRPALVEVLSTLAKDKLVAFVKAQREDKGVWIRALRVLESATPAPAPAPVAGAGAVAAADDDVLSKNPPGRRASRLPIVPPAFFDGLAAGVGFLSLSSSLFRPAPRRRVLSSGARRRSRPAPAFARPRRRGAGRRNGRRRPPIDGPPGARFSVDIREVLNEQVIRAERERAADRPRSARSAGLESRQNFDGASGNARRAQRKRISDASEAPYPPLRRPRDFAKWVDPERAGPSG